MTQSRPKQVKAGKDGENCTDLREAVQIDPEQAKAGENGENRSDLREAVQIDPEQAKAGENGENCQNLPRTGENRQNRQSRLSSREQFVPFSKILYIRCESRCGRREQARTG